MDPEHRPLHIAASGPKPEILQLASYDNAAGLRDYLLRLPNPGSIAARQLVIPDAGPLDAAKAKNLEVEIKKLNW